MDFKRSHYREVEALTLPNIFDLRFREPINDVQKSNRVRVELQHLQQI
jgi:hypothetical protein